MKNFYFTFGNNDKNHPFHGGWVIVKAPSINKAIDIFNAYFPKKENSEVCNCALVYTQSQFMKTQMYKTGNFGCRCHGIIGFKALKNKERNYEEGSESLHTLQSE